MAPIDLFCDCQGALDVLWGGPGAGAHAGGPRAHLWASFWSSFGPGDFTASKTAAHCTMADVHRGKTTLCEKKANDSVDSYAKMGAAKHLLCESDVNLYRGFKSLVKESAKWAANFE
eukprot:9479854-Pyramimonas_sp.AAC.1